MRRLSRVLSGSLSLRRKSRRRHCAVSPEPLECRVLLTNYIVDTLVDESDGNFEPGDFSLREAIEQANTNVGADTIEFSPLLTDGTIVLGGSELVISDALTITGLGADRLTIDGNNASRIVSIDNAVTVSLSALSLTRGNGIGKSFNESGGAILSQGVLSLDGVRIHHNTVDSDFVANGAGIHQVYGTLVVQNSTVDNNRIIRNGTGTGGGIRASSANVTLINSTIANNVAGTGAGVYLTTNAIPVQVTIRNSTIAFNSAGRYGGGVTTANVGGITLTLHNSIVIGNQSLGEVRNFYGPFASPESSHNIVGTGRTGGLLNGVNGNQTGVNAATVLQNTLAYNGGLTPTLALLSGSPAIDAGDNAQPLDASNNPLTFDQRGTGFTRFHNGTVDVGAVELPTPVTYAVDTLVDESDGDFSAGDLSLREAIELANATEMPDRITFSNLNGTLSVPQDTVFQIDAPLALHGPGRENLTIQARILNVSRFLLISNINISGLISTPIVNAGGIHLSGVGLVGNGSKYNSTGIDNSGTAFLDDCTVSQNTGLFDETLPPGNFGGGPLVNTLGGTIIIRGSVVSDNYAIDDGDSSGLLNRGTAYISNSVFQRNRSLLENYGSIAGSILSLGNLTAFNSSFSETKGDYANVVNAGFAIFVDCSFADNGDGYAVFNRSYGGDVPEARFTRSVFQNNSTAIRNFGRIVTDGCLFNENNVGIYSRSNFSVAPMVSVSSINTTFTGHSSAALESESDLKFTTKVSLVNSTITKNAEGVVTSNSQLAVRNSVIISNDGDLRFALYTNADFQHSIVGVPAPEVSITNGTNGNITGVTFDQVLLPLADNGGPTLTFAPRPNGPAIDAGSNALAVDENGDPLLFDQRGPGFRRIVNGTVDIGAVEHRGAVTPPADDLIVYDQASGRWKVGLNQGTSFSWVDGPRWNPSAGWQTWTGDVNGDGYLDGIGFNSSNAVFFAVNDGTGKLVSTPGGSFSSSDTFQYPMVGDFDGNGTTDFLAMLSTGQWFSKRWNGTSFETGYLGKFTPTGWAEFAVGDFNGDNVDDIVGLRDSDDGTRANFIYGLSNTTPVGRRFTSQFAGGFGSSVAQTGWHNLLVGEFNGDGKSDILTQTGSGQFWYAVSNGTPITTPVDLGAKRLSLSAGSNYPSAAFSNEFHLGDFNGDGLDDIVTRLPNVGQTYDSHVWVGLTSFGTTANMTSSRWAIWGRTVNWGAEIVGDYDGDGLDDLAGLDVGRQIAFVSLSTGTSFTTTTGFGIITGANSILDPDAADCGPLG